MLENDKITPIEHLPSPKMRFFFRVFCAAADLFGGFGNRFFTVDNSRNRRLIARGSQLARRVEGKQWDVYGDEIEQLLIDTLVSLEESVNARNQHAVARMIISGAIKVYLQRRVQTYEYLLKNPSILELKIDKPVIVAGFPRTGSTLMHRLLAQGDNARAYQYWELVEPVPSPSPSIKKDWRVWKLGMFMKCLNLMVAGHRESIEAFHMASATTVEEETVLMWCVGLMNPVTLLHGNDVICEKILSPAGRAGSYRFLRRSLQILNARYPQNIQLCLKSPFHSLYLDALLDEFPDARLITIHRNPKDIVESWLSFMSRVVVPTFRERSFTMQEFCEPQLQFLRQSGQRMVEVLGAAEEGRFAGHLPLCFTDFVSDPVKTMEQVYSFLGKGPLSLGERKKMESFLRNKDAQKTLLPKLTLGELGVSQADISKYFAEYSRVFGHLY